MNDGRQMAKHLKTMTLVACSLFAFAIGLAVGIGVHQIESKAQHQCEGTRSAT